MNPSSNPNIPARARLAWAALIAALLPASGFAQATPPPPPVQPPEEAVTLEAFTVTGSNIRRVDEEKILPVSVIGTDDLECGERRLPPNCSNYCPTVASSRWAKRTCLERMPAVTM